MTTKNCLERGSLFFNVVDLRNGRGVGKIKIGPGEPSDRIFNHVSHDSNHDLRLKFAGLFASQALSGVVLRMGYRAYSILAGHSITRGKIEGEREFKLYRLKQYLYNKPISPKMEIYFIRKRILIELVTDIVKLATYPIAIVGLQFAAAWGMLLPLDGLMFTSVIEELWHQKADPTKHLRICGLKITFFLYAAPCMQSQENWRKKEIYSLNSNPKTLRNLQVRMENYLDLWYPYFGDHYTRIKDELFKMKTDIISKASPPSNEKEEIDGPRSLLNLTEDEYADKRRYWEQETKENDEKYRIKYRQLKFTYEKLEQFFDTMKTFVSNCDAKIEDRENDFENVTKALLEAYPKLLREISQFNVQVNQVNPQLVTPLIQQATVSN